MNMKMLLILGLGGLVVYMIIKTTSAPKPTGPAAVLTDLGKLVGDFSGNAV